MRIVGKGMVVLLFFVLPVRSHAQAAIIEAVKNAAAKIIKAVDLKIQRLQNKTIWLQNAQQTLENALSKLKLQEIGDWVEKQRALYDDYFQELYKVKSAISTYHRLKDMIGEQALLVKAYRRAYDLFRADNHFTADEIAYMREIYQGILDESLRNLDQIAIVINAFAVQMDDAHRMAIIEDAAQRIDQNYQDLKRFNYENAMLSVQRARALDEVEVLRKIYGDFITE